MSSTTKRRPVEERPENDSIALNKQQAVRASVAISPGWSVAGLRCVAQAHRAAADVTSPRSRLTNANALQGVLDCLTDGNPAPKDRTPNDRTMGLEGATLGSVCFTRLPPHNPNRATLVRSIGAVSSAKARARAPRMMVRKMSRLVTSPLRAPTSVFNRTINPRLARGIAASQ